MLWLDSNFPTDSTKLGADRGSCPTTSGKFEDMITNHADANVAFCMFPHPGVKISSANTVISQHQVRPHRLYFQHQPSCLVFLDQFCHHSHHQDHEHQHQHQDYYHHHHLHPAQPLHRSRLGPVRRQQLAWWHYLCFWCLLHSPERVVLPVPSLLDNESTWEYRELQTRSEFY